MCCELSLVLLRSLFCLFIPALLSFSVYRSMYTTSTTQPRFSFWSPTWDPLTHSLSLVKSLPSSCLFSPWLCSYSLMWRRVWERRDAIIKLMPLFFILSWFPNDISVQISLLRFWCICPPVLDISMWVEDCKLNMPRLNPSLVHLSQSPTPHPLPKSVISVTGLTTHLSIPVRNLSTLFRSFIFIQPLIKFYQFSFQNIIWISPFLLSPFPTGYVCSTPWSL